MLQAPAPCVPDGTANRKSSRDRRMVTAHAVPCPAWPADPCAERVRAGVARRLTTSGLKTAFAVLRSGNAASSVLLR
jgi:hypothetical protein